MAISYSNEATECTEAEIKNKPKDEQKILNDDDATQAAEKKQENANPDKTEKPDPSGSVSESVEDDVDFEDLDEGALQAALGVGIVGTICAIGTKITVDRTKTLNAAIKEYEETNKDLIPLTKLTCKKYGLGSADKSKFIEQAPDNSAKNAIAQADTIKVWYDGQTPIFAISYLTSAAAGMTTGGDGAFGFTTSTTFIPFSSLAQKHFGYYSSLGPHNIFKAGKQKDKTKSPIFFAANSWLKDLYTSYRKRHKGNIDEDALPEEKLAMAKALVEEVQIENEVMALVNEAAEELCLDEEYVKNEVRKDAIIKGKLMKEAKAHAKAAKTAIKKMDTETAISEQEQYVAALKKLYEECSNIKDDSKMIIVSSAVIRGLLASTGALLVGAELAVVHGMTKHGGMKTDGAILDVKSEKDQELAYNALSKHFGSKAGKIEVAATAVVSIVSGIIAGVLKYKKGMLKYGVKNEKTHKLEVAKSRIEAQQRLRRMVRLAEQILNEYKSIQKIESGK